MVQIISSLIRHLATVLAGGLIADGVLSDADIQVVIGGVTAIVTVGWSIIEKVYFSGKK
jgi:hypothetical protein